MNVRYNASSDLGHRRDTPTPAAFRREPGPLAGAALRDWSFTRSFNLLAIRALFFALSHGPVIATMVARLLGQACERDACFQRARRTTGWRRVRDFSSRLAMPRRSGGVCGV